MPAPMNGARSAAATRVGGRSVRSVARAPVPSRTPGRAVVIAAVNSDAPNSHHDRRLPVSRAAALRPLPGAFGCSLSPFTRLRPRVPGDGAVRTGWLVVVHT